MPCHWHLLVDPWLGILKANAIRALDLIVAVVMSGSPHSRGQYVSSSVPTAFTASSIHFEVFVVASRFSEDVRNFVETYSPMLYRVVDRLDDGSVQPAYLLGDELIRDPVMSQ